MKVDLLDPPRVFDTGRGEIIQLKDCGRIALEPDEQITLTTPSGGQYDVARKRWGFYATPSLNGRLMNFGLRAALIKSYVGKYYVFLVERGHEPELAAYLDKEKNVLVRWLDNDADLAAAESSESPRLERVRLHCMCRGDRFTSVHMYFAQPAGESSFGHQGAYRRELFRCSLCGHFISVHDMHSEAFYEGGYVDGTYGDAAGVRRTFDRIVSLTPARSDNTGRVRRIDEVATAHLGRDRRTVLDVGSGLCVFLHRMKEAGWHGTALDPDPRAAEHARGTVGVDAVCADWMNAGDLGRFDLITFNKVLEHVEDPVAMLARSSEHLRPGGLVYVELPDGEAAAPPAGEGYGREEFFIEHHHVFSLASLSLLAEHAGLRALSIERLREPSSKYTLRAFLTEKAPERK